MIKYTAELIQLIFAAPAQLIHSLITKSPAEDIQGISDNGKELADKISGAVDGLKSEVEKQLRPANDTIEYWENANDIDKGVALVYNYKNHLSGRDFIKNRIAKYVKRFAVDAK